MGNVLVCLLLHRFVNGPILFFRLLVLRPYLDQYLRQNVQELQALELSDWDALNAIYEVLGLARDATKQLEGEQIPTGSLCPEVSMAVCLHHGPAVPCRPDRSAELSPEHRCPFGTGDEG